jgi:uncharacterized protein
MVLAYGLMDLTAPLPKPQLPILMVPLFFVAFVVLAAGEELGWQGYAIDRLQKRWNALEASLMVGAVWAIWHIVPLTQTHRTPAWIAWQCLEWPHFGSLSSGSTTTQEEACWRRLYFMPRPT